MLGQEGPDGLSQKLEAVIDARVRVPGLHAASDVPIHRVLGEPDRRPVPEGFLDTLARARSARARPRVIDRLDLVR